ncbi:nuclear transport factor 2 family protein [Ideonella azotifigens]|uniref:Nuclear transport factor 2 family protein n=1 Tax=Ideonella azotifigens TaxID=513160 RepID=A0ABN1JVH4_9BURK|nr:nuclear transport factor 2 family protein [Ideonella azotifigens]MCD2341168.1 nuclear transport factor 2 family protein [Ideonella azotifigens]
MSDGTKAAMVEQWIARQACADLVVRGVSCIDARDHDGFAALFADDGVLVRPGAEPLHGPAAIAASYRSRPSDRLTRHLITNTLVTLQTSSRAHGHSCVLLWSGLSSDEAGLFGRPAQPRQVLGEFEDDFVCTPSGWRIARREARFVLFREDAE